MTWGRVISSWTISRSGPSARRMSRWSWDRSWGQGVGGAVGHQAAPVDDDDALAHGLHLGQDVGA